ncbi:MAG: hypothetical protein KC800_11200 [Candidatus Eremiobacteraeota bacterium]|nr:hypothetical protein [Candidatus Eremiobacteraeota bacterium]
MLEYPRDNVEVSRNSRPVVLLHGTLVEKDGIAAYKDYALRTGHPVNHRTYQSITKGDRIEESTELASRQVNLSRAEIAQSNVKTMSAMDRSELKKALSIDGNLYGAPDPEADRVLDEAPALIKDIGELLGQPTEEIAKSLSGQLKKLESRFAERLVKKGMDEKKSEAVSRELVDTVAPRAIVVGHSAGGYVAYTLAVNPEVTPDNNPFTYDGGNGVGEVVVLSAPIKSGLPKPAPPGVADLPFYNWESNFLRPLEELPPTQLLLANPVVDFAYDKSKALLRSASRLGFMVTATLTSPITHLLRPGNEQVEEGSSFFRNYVENKEIPAGTSIIGVTSPLDNLSQEDRSKLETEQTNGHTISIDLQVSDEQIKRERPTWAHVIMTEKPDSFKYQFSNYLEDKPEALVKLLDGRNDDGVRHEALTMVRRQLENKPDMLGENPELRAALEKVAAEKIPFTDSPSYLAHQILG